MKNFFIKTMGCKSNQLESALIEENLVKNGFTKVEKVSDADFFILNSCTVTHKSDKEAFYIMHKAKKDNPDIKNILTGCVAQIEKENLLSNPDIDVVLGNDEKLEMANFLSEKFAVKNIMKLSEFHKLFLCDTKKTRASLKIQDGCNNRCAYCIIPFARGQSRCADSDFILEQIKLYEKADFKEIILTGIHIGQWKEQNTDKDLLYLLERIENETNIKRFRLGSLNPLEIDDKMLNFLKSSEKFCQHFHLSLQSMCDKTLKSMNRHYSAKRSLDLIEQISEMFPLGFIGSDVIAGFPDETEEDFSTTVENIKTSKLTQIHTFPYSIRKGTSAETMSNHIDPKIKEKRADVLKKISENKLNEFWLQNSGKTLEVLIEKKLDKKTNMLKGLTRNYIKVLIPTDGVNVDAVKNSIQNVKILCKDKNISGKIVQSDLYV